MPGILQNIFDNPILTRELRRRMRGKALVYSIIGYIILMSVTSILIMLTTLDPFTVGTKQSTQELLQKMTGTGQTLFQWITGIQAMLVLIIAPTITAGMTTGEKEKKTFEFLRVTTITPWMYILGCFLSTVFYVSLALLCALPLISLAFLYGGVGRVDVVKMTGILLGISMVLSSFGLYISSIRERTRTAQGIVVFLIFSLVFGGSIAYQQITRWLGVSSAAAGTSPGSPGAAATGSGISILGLYFPPWTLVGLGMLALTMVFLLMAARKLFEPDDTRAINHWQFALITLVVMAIMTWVATSGVLSNLMLLAYLGMGCLLLLVAVLSFSVGRMEVGDEIWHLKRLIPFLRPIDQTIPYLVVLGCGWFALVHKFQTMVSLPGNTSPELLESILLVSLTGFAFLCVFGRFATAMAVDRRRAGRITLIIASLFWFVLPIICGILISALELENGFGYTIAAGIARFSPFFIMIEGLDNTTIYTASTPLFRQPGIIAAMCYSGLFGIFLILGEFMRFKRWRGFDYHYDMPSA